MSECECVRVSASHLASADSARLATEARVQQPQQTCKYVGDEGDDGDVRQVFLPASLRTRGGHDCRLRAVE